MSSKSARFCILAVFLFHLCDAQAQLPAKHLTKPASRVASIPASDPCYRKLSSTGPLVAYSVMVPSHGATLVEPHHQDYLLIALKKADLTLSGPYGNTFQLHLEGGGMQVINGGWAHRVSNLDDTGALLVEIDVAGGIKPGHAACGLAASECADGRFGKTDEGTYSQSTLFDTPTVRLSRISLGPGGVLEQHRHGGDDMLVPLGPAHLDNDEGGLSPSRLNLDPGEVYSLPAGTAHRIRNVASQPVQFLEFERK